MEFRNEIAAAVAAFWAVAGFGIGAFLVMPRVAMSYVFAHRKPALTLIDGVNSVVGCTTMGAVLNLF
jgi:hypothetical protein